MNAAGMAARFVRLRMLGQRCENWESELAAHRAERDALALELVEAGCSWREVAEAAGFSNPYIAELKRRADARPVPVPVDEPDCEMCEGKGSLGTGGLATPCPHCAGSGVPGSEETA